jgi:hypothetical protein
MDTQPKEEVEKHDMQSKVESMTARETNEPLDSRLCTEGEIISKKEVVDKADDITCNISHIGRRAEQQQVINAIMDSRRESSIQYESYKLPELRAVQQLFYFFTLHVHIRCKVTKSRAQKQRNSFLFLPRRSKFAIRDGKVTKKACKSEAIWED